MKLDGTESNGRAHEQVINSDSFHSLFKNMSAIDSLIREAESAFKDARTAAWRYFVLSEASQVLRIRRRADGATQKLSFARRDVANDAVSRGHRRAERHRADTWPSLKSNPDTIDLQTVSRPKPSARRRLRRASSGPYDFDLDRAQRPGDGATVRRGVAKANRTRLAVGLAVSAAVDRHRGVRRARHRQADPRIGEVLMRLANGHTSVAIPYTTARRDRRHRAASPDFQGQPVADKHKGKRSREAQKKKKREKTRKKNENKHRTHIDKTRQRDQNTL